MLSCWKFFPSLYNSRGWCSIGLAAVLSATAAPAAAQVPPGCRVSAIDGTVVNCIGNHAAGIAFNNGAGPFETLHVFALTSDITPASGTAGISFSSDMPGYVEVDLGRWKIETTGNGAAGIAAQTSLLNPLTLFLAGDIATSGDNAEGVFASTADGSLALLYAGTITTQGITSIGLRAESTGGEVMIASAGSITTAGDDAHAIQAQSASGIALVYSASDIRTSGVASVGIVSDGANGSVVFFEGSVTTTHDLAAGIAARATSSGDAIVYSAGDITTIGASADGIVAMAANGNAAVINTGNVSATGIGSAGIAVSAGDSATVLNTGHIVGGPCCAAVMMDAGSQAILLNEGTITAGLSGYAVDMLAPSNDVLNTGTITGSVIMADAGLNGAGVFENTSRGVLNSGDLMVAAMVVNDGTIAPGGHGKAQTTFVSDNFTQTKHGVYAVDLDPRASNPADRQDFIGVSNFASLTGNVAVNFISVPLTAAETFVILSAVSGLADNGLGLVAGPAANAKLEFLGNDLVLSYDIDFVADRLNPNQRAIAANLRRIFGAGGGGVSPVLIGLLNTTGITGYENALNQLSPELYSDAQISAVYGSLAFSNTLMSCRVNGADTAAIVREGQCLWAGASARFLDTRTTRDQIGFTEAAGLFTAGAQIALDEAWRLGFAGGYQNSTFSNGANAQSDGSIVQAGVALKYNPGPLLLAGALSGGGGWYETTRPMAFGGFLGTAESDSRMGFINGGLRAAHVVGTSQLYWKPMMDLNLTYFSLGSFTETGGNGAALTVHGASKTLFSAAPTIEVGSEFWLSNGTLVRPLVRGGAIWYSDDDFALTAGFAEAPAGVGTFTINTDIDQVMGVIGAGLEIVNADNDALRLTYDAQLGETTQIHSVAIRGSASF